MQQASSWYLAIFAILVVAGPRAAAASEEAERETAAALRAIEQRRASLTAEDLKAARRLNLQGDRAYRKERYGAAARSYMHSYPNHPNAYAYIMSGDSHWRAVVQHHSKKAVPAEAAAPACRLRNEHFARDLAMDVARHHEVGLSLAQREGEATPERAQLYRRARESAACLKGLSQYYETQPASECVEVSKLQDCLGDPLIK